MPFSTYVLEKSGPVHLPDPVLTMFGDEERSRALPSNPHEIHSYSCGGVDVQGKVRGSEEKRGKGLVLNGRYV